MYRRKIYRETIYLSRRDDEGLTAAAPRFLSPYGGAVPSRGVRGAGTDVAAVPHGRPHGRHHDHAGAASVIELLRSEGAAGGLRAGLLLLVVLTVVGTALALAFHHHWGSPLEMLPWIVLGITMVGWIALVARQTRATIWLARGVAVLAIVVAAVGVWQHTDANYNADTAPSNRAADSGDEEPAADDPSLMDAMTGAVGDAPVPAAMAIVPVGLALALATIGLGGAGRSEG